MKKGVIIQGSARSKGDTYGFCQKLKTQSGFDFIDLKQYDIGHFDYTFSNKDDDFLPLIREILDTYELLTLATPVYWYTMSGHMKVFLDRISDLLYSEKETGRLFRTKTMSILSVSGDDQVDDTFYLPFRKSADYLGMHYAGDCHAYAGITDEALVNRFRELKPTT